MKVTHIDSTHGKTFEKEVNRAINTIEENGSIIVDIQYSTSVRETSYVQFSALIVYLNQVEYREVKINKLLEDQ